MGAQNNLAVFYERGGRGVPVNLREAVRLFKLADAQGHPESAFSLGCIYDPLKSPGHDMSIMLNLGGGMSIPTGALSSPPPRGPASQQAQSAAAASTARPKRRAIQAATGFSRPNLRANPKTPWLSAMTRPAISGQASSKAKAAPLPRRGRW